MRRTWFFLAAVAVALVIAACGADGRGVAGPDSTRTIPSTIPDGAKTPGRPGAQVSTPSTETPAAPASGAMMSGGAEREVYERTDRLAPRESVTYYAGHSSPGGDTTLSGRYIFDDAGGDGVELLVRRGDRTEVLSAVCGDPPLEVGAAGSYTISTDCGGDPESVTLENGADVEIRVIRLSSILGGAIPVSAARGPEPGGGTVSVTFRLALEGDAPAGQGFNLRFDADGASDAVPVTHGGDALVEFCGAPHSGVENMGDCTGGGVYTRTVRFERGTTLRYYHFTRVGYGPGASSGLGPFRGDSGVRLDRDTAIAATYAFSGTDGEGAGSEGDGFATCDPSDISPGVRVRSVRGRTVITVPISTRGPQCLLTGTVSLTLRGASGAELSVSGNGVPYIIGATVPTGEGVPTFVWSNWCGRRGEHVYETTLSIGRVRMVSESRESRAPRCDARGGRSGLGALGLEQAQAMP